MLFLSDKSLTRLFQFQQVKEKREEKKSYSNWLPSLGRPERTRENFDMNNIRRDLAEMGDPGLLLDSKTPCTKKPCTETPCIETPCIETSCTEILCPETSQARVTDVGSSLNAFRGFRHPGHSKTAPLSVRRHASPVRFLYSLGRHSCAYNPQ